MAKQTTLQAKRIGTTEEAIMRQSRLRVLQFVGFAAIAVVVSTSVAEAQTLSQGRTVNWENARRLYPMIVSATDAGNQNEAVNRLDELAANLDEIERHIAVPLQQLHDLDRRQLESDSATARDRLNRARVNAKSLKDDIKSTGKISSSMVGYFKSSWGEFADAFVRFAERYTAYWNRDMKELQERVKRFQAACGRDCS